MPSLANQVVLITGASAGIGEAVALEAAKRGARLVLAARREGLLRNVKDLVESRGAEALVVPTDMADTAQVEALAQKALDHFGRVDILVNNAGYGQMGPVEEVDVAAMRRQFEVNVFGLHALTRALLPQMRERGSGRILNLSSVAGQLSMPFSGVYSATKFAVEALSDAPAGGSGPLRHQGYLDRAGAGGHRVWPRGGRNLCRCCQPQRPLQGDLGQDRRSGQLVQQNGLAGGEGGGADPEGDDRSSPFRPLHRFHGG
jgi:short-subunit dehydrogenase involved in D-alanine esterification of teichoic acids